MLPKLRSFLVKAFPSLGTCKRYFLALYDSFLPSKFSYSQNSEDSFLKACLDRYDLNRGIYVDVGSNHPTSISNTYLFYRLGLHGVAIEPNFELSKLHHKIRPRDIVISIGCGKEPSLGSFKVGKAPVLSHFYTDEKNYQVSKNLGFELWKTEYIPILPLDIILNEIEYEWIFLLSIDVEGLDYEVLQGSVNVLSKVLFCCVESNSESETINISNFLDTQGFKLIHKIGCNLIYSNQNIWFKQYLAQDNIVIS